MIAGPAEGLLLGSALLLVPLGRWLRDRPAVFLGLTVPVWALALAAWGFRLASLPAGLEDRGVRFVVGWSAHRVAEATGPVALAALAVGLGWLAATRGWSSARPPPLAWVGAGALGVGAALLGGAGVWALPLGAWLVVPARPADDAAARAWLGAAFGVASCGAVGALGEALSMYGAASGPAVAAAGALVALAGAVAGLATSPPRGLPAAVTAAPSLAALGALVAFAPLTPPGLGGGLPVAEPADVPYRVPFGCVVAEDGAVRAVSGFWGSPECPEGAAGFPRGRRPHPPLFALSADAPIEATWPTAGGEAAFLARWPAAGGLSWGTIRVDVSVALPTEPDPQRVVVDPQGRAPVTPGARASVVIPQDAAPTVERFLSVCRRAKAAGGAGVRCVVGAGPSGSWR